MPDEPTLSDVLATVLAAIEAARVEASHRADRIEARLDRVDAAIGQVRADIGAVKAELAVIQVQVDDTATWAHRHDGDPGAHRRAA